MDESRLISISERNPDYSLSVKSNREILEIICDKMTNQDLSDSELKIILSNVSNINEIDNTFRQISAFLHEPPHDLLSIGSMIIGELESKSALLDLGGDSD